MAFSGGFGKNSGPGTAPQPEISAVRLPQSVPLSHPLPVLPNESRLRWVDPKASTSRNDDLQSYQRPPELVPRAAPGNPRTISPKKAAQDPKRTRSPSSLSQDEEISKNSRMFMGGSFFSSPMWVNVPKSEGNNNNSPDQENMLSTRTNGGAHQSGRMFQTNHADVLLPKQTRFPAFPSIRGASPLYTSSASVGQKRSPIDYSDLDAPEEAPSPPLAFEGSVSAVDYSRPYTGSKMPFSSSPSRAYRFNSSGNNTTPPSRDGLAPFSTTGDLYPSQETSHVKRTDALLPKRTRSPTFPSMSESFTENHVFALDGYGRVPDSQSHEEFSKSGKANSFEVTANRPLNFPIGKRAKLPLLSSSDQFIQENSDSAQEIERELQSKAKRLARFKDELSQPKQNATTFKNQKHALEKPRPREDSKMDATADFVDIDVISDYQGGASSGSIAGVCPDMCPESERAERERKGDLDYYERLDGDRNLSSKSIAVKKYTRTAEREAELIRPMPILQNTMDYLLNLLDQPYDNSFLGLYNFLWDRMRAIRMDLRMQHIFDLQAVRMLEQMIRLHILAMHELCEYTKGEGFSEGFDAHLNIEQMNKTSVELFQFYDDHRKKGIHVPSEREFRGYYALLKLDKHPGYKVEPTELSLDLAKMAPEMRQTPEVLFARDVARACRTGNFIAFFRLAHRASYLQACLMHAHFSKLRGHAFASLHSGLQINQGIPLTQVAKWLAMEEENIEELLEYYGFSVKIFEEPYMVKEHTLVNGDIDYPVKCSKLVGRKRSKMIVNDVSSPSLAESYDIGELRESPRKRDPEQKSKPLQLVVPGSMVQPIDQEMHDSVTNLSPKGDMQNHMHRTFSDLMSQDEQRTFFKSQVVPASPMSLDFSNSSSENDCIRFGNEQKTNYDFRFRNSFGRTIKHDLELTPPPITRERDEKKSPALLPIDSLVDTSIPEPLFTEYLEAEDQTGVVDEDTANDAETSYCDEEVAEAKLKLVLRTWKRRTTKKKELRDHKRAEACAALNSLWQGPPIWQYEAQSDAHGVLDIDLIMNMRRKIQGRSWSVLNPSDVVAAKLAEKNPDAKCLCWKLLLCSLEETPYRDDVGQKNDAVPSAAGSWLRSKFMDASNNEDGDLIISSPDLAIWKTWIPWQSSAEQICCLSVVKSAVFEDLDNSRMGASAVLFLLSENIPLELQKNHLHDLILSLPSGSRVPLLILSVTEKDESDLSTVAKDLGLHDIDKSRVSVFSFSFLKDQQTEQFDGFFSDERLRGGLEWLAGESPQQIDVRSIKLRELVISHLNSTLEVLDGMDTYKIGPNQCILAFNEALDRSMENIATAAHANPICWPCPEIDLLDESSDEYRAVKWYLPSRGWNTSVRTERFRHALYHSKLPAWEDDIAWLSWGFNIGDIENQKMQLESCLMKYLTETSQTIGSGLARKEASALLQKCTRLELHHSSYYIVPSWVKIFRRIFNWRLMNITTDEVSSTYVLVQRDISAPTSEIPDFSESVVHELLPSYIDYPSFDELVEVGRETVVPVHTVYEAFKPMSPAAYRDHDDNPTFGENDVLMETEKRSENNEQMVTCYDHSSIVANSGDQLISSSKPTREPDRLSELLQKCNILQNKIDKKLSIYFDI
ncbi:SAC3 family protein B isoform X1 [Primulina huaijiensis]|uniref:SAC3 family protein B isoform X1 n=1 Tax=Primulina huaijiensis TaxID=1492673 RepID=UPI003CC701EF